MSQLVNQLVSQSVSQSVSQLLNGASHETKIGCIHLVWAGARYKF